MRLKVRAEYGDLLWRRRRGRGDIARVATKGREGEKSPGVMSAV